MTAAAARREAQETEELLLLKNYPALASYINRIGARVRNFRSFAIQEMDEDSGYWRDLVRIKIKPDGTINVNVMPKAGEDIKLEDYEPTDEEKEQIRGCSFPHSIKASFGPGDMPADLIGVNVSEYFLYADEKEKGLITWVQWRREDDEGRTFYLPYSKWSDGIWRRMEPDGLLPLYGLDRLAKSFYGARRVMIHEGAKCARHVQALVDSKASHPWMPDLSMYTHLGWPGGVNSADRVDWDLTLPPTFIQRRLESGGR